ncbi:MAG: glycosyltransferase, partial [Eubacteriales bacterium]|nr:glycosyltransferase [Eubacteriales bacterium]
MEQTKNRIIIDKQIVSKREVTCYYHVEGSIAERFPEKKSLKLIYPAPLGALPKEVLVVPFLGCFLPMAMLWDAEVCVESVEKTAYDYLTGQTKKFHDEFPEKSFGGNIAAGEIKELPGDSSEGHVILFGNELESLYRLIAHRKDFPKLLYVRGTGEPEEDGILQNHLEKRIIDAAEKFQVEAEIIHVPFRGWLKANLIEVPGCWELAEPMVTYAIAIPYLWKNKLSLYEEAIPDDAEEMVKTIEDFENRVKVSVRKPFFEKKETKTEEADFYPSYAWILGVSEHGNLGDHQIVESVEEMLGDLAPGMRFQEIALKDYAGRKGELLKIVRKEDPLIFLGGGFFGNLWPRGDELREDAFRTWPDNPKIVFPQSVFYTDDEEGKEALKRAKSVYRGEKMLLAFRDPASYEIAKREFQCPVMLTPDIAMYSYKKEYNHEERSGVLTLLREDKEVVLTEEDRNQVFEFLDSKWDHVTRSDMQGRRTAPSARRIVLDQMFEKIGSSELVVTDRLHGLIFSILTETPCVAFGNAYHKIRAYEAWLQEIPYVTIAHSVEELPECVEKVLGVSDPTYPLEHIRKYYEIFEKNLQNMLQEAGKAQREHREDNPLVSVIVPVYNVERYLSECLDSVLKQTYKNYEVVCVNDGSTDGSVKILEEYASKDARIRILSQENGGLSAARNHGLKEAKGKYLLFLDSDDLWLPTTLEELVCRGEKDDLDLMLFNMKPFIQSEECSEDYLHFERTYQRQFDYPDTCKGSRLLSMLKKEGEYRASACQFMIRMDLMEKYSISFVRGILHEDNPFTLEVMLASERTGFVNRSFYLRRVTPGSIMTSETAFRHAYGYFRSYIEIHRFLEKMELSDWEERLACQEADRVLRMAVSNYEKL